MPSSKAGALAWPSIALKLFLCCYKLALELSHYPFDYPFETDNSCRYSLMGNQEPDIEFSYSLRF